MLPLKLLSQFLYLLAHTFLALFTLSLFVHGSALHDSRDYFGSIDVLEFVVSDLAVDLEGLGDGVGVVGERHEFGDAVVDGGWGGVWEGEEEGFGEGEGRAEDDGVNVLACISFG